MAMADGTDDTDQAGSTGRLQWDKNAGHWADAGRLQGPDDRREPRLRPGATPPAEPDRPPGPGDDGAVDPDRALRTDDLDAFFSLDADIPLDDVLDDSRVLEDSRPASDPPCLPVGRGRGFPDAGAFAAFISAATVPPETSYGRAIGDMLGITPAPRFFTDPHGPTILADIESLNRRHGVTIVRVPGTSVRLVNYTYCPRCDTVHSRRDVMAYFSNPDSPDDAAIPRRQQLRGDPRVACKTCREMFLPSLLVVDGKPTSECPFLGTLQTIDAIEVVYLKHSRRKVLTRNPDNIVHRKGRRMVRNDVWIGDLIEHPTLMANLVLHTPPDLVTSLIEGRNVANEEPLMGLQF